MNLDPDRWRAVRTVFNRAAELDGEARACYLTEACQDDPSLREEVEALLQADPHADAALSPAVAAAAGELAGPEALLPDTLGPYRLLAKVGQGGMGVVYRAIRADGTYENKVAIKVMASRFADAQAIARFRSERQILADLDHPAIARLIDGGTTEDGTPYLVMEYVDGEPIDTYCTKRNLGLEERLALALGVCDAVAHAHARLVVHRDLKPANILITAEGKPKLLDFGIAKILDGSPYSSLTRSGLLPLTPRYASPEQIDGSPITVATDVYSLGIVLYEMLTGVSPYGELPRSTPAHYAEAIRNHEPVRLSAAASAKPAADSQGIDAKELAGDLEAIVGMALRKEPERRYASIEQLAADLRRRSNGMPVSAVPDRWGYRTGKWLRRNAVSVSLVLIAFLALAGGFVARTIEARRAARATERANAEAATANRVSSFLEDIYLAATPGDAGDRDITVREVLDASVGRIEGELSEEPLVQARLFKALGSAYKGLGAYEEAEPLLTRALDLVLASPDAAPSNIALTRIAVADLLKDLQRPEDAESHLRAALAIFESTELRGSHDHVYTLHRLGLALNHQLRLDEAEVFLTEAAALAAEIPEPDRNVQLSLTFVLGSLYADQGKPKKAHEVILQGLELAREIYGDEHMATLIGLNNAGQSLVELALPVEAEPYLREAMAVAEALLGPPHPLYGTVQRNLGASLARQGRFEEAEPLLQAALENHVQVYGEDQFLTHLVRTSIALIRLRQGEIDEADTTFSRALEAIEPDFGAEHVVVAELLHFRGEVREAQGRTAEAHELFDRARAIREKIFGADGEPTRESLAARERSAP